MAPTNVMNSEECIVVLALTQKIVNSISLCSIFTLDYFIKNKKNTNCSNYKHPFSTPFVIIRVTGQDAAFGCRDWSPVLVDTVLRPSVVQDLLWHTDNTNPPILPTMSSLIVSKKGNTTGRCIFTNQAG